MEFQKLVMTSAQVYGAMGTFEKAIQTTKEKVDFYVNKIAPLSINSYCQEPLSNVDVEYFNALELKLNKFTKIHQYLTDFYIDYRNGGANRQSLMCDEFMTEAERYTHVITPKWAR